MGVSVRPSIYITVLFSRLARFFNILQEYILQEDEVLKTDGVDFFWKNSCLPESRPNLQDWLTSFFLYFAWSWGTISTHNWRSRIFWRNSFFCKNWPKRPKMVWFVYYGSIFSQDWLIRFVSCFAWSWGTINREI